jgi:YHS domain-containing protein
MSSTCMVIPMPISSRTRRLLATLAVLALSPVWTAVASAAVPWHQDLPTARRASEVSHRPVLAIFTASWSSASTTLDRTTLASDEAVALIKACFEPVCVDVDANPEATRRLGITKVPTACIVTADDRLLSKFELPETPAGFVAAAARAAQEAAFASAVRSSEPGSPSETSVSLREFADMPESGSGALPSFGSGGTRVARAVTSTDIHGTVPPGGKAVNAVAAKVRMLSDFASDDAAPASGPESAIAASFRDTTIREATIRDTGISSHTAAPVAAPVMASVAPSVVAPVMTPAAESPAAVASAVVATASIPEAAATIPAMPAAAPAAVNVAPQAAPTTLAADSALGRTATQSPLAIDPAPTSPATPSHAAAKSAPWLGLPPQNQPATAAQPEAAVAAIPAASASGIATTSGTQSLADGRAVAAQPAPTDPRPATPEQPTAGGMPLAETKPQKPSATASLLAALQKPFSLFSKPAAAKPTPSSENATASASTQTAAAPVAPAEPDTYGSMPVGLEGYCPVTLAERGAWVEGRAQWGARHRGRTYLFASAEQQKAFLADPDRYAPALSGDDPVLAFDVGKSTPGQRRYGVTYQSRTYLFSSTETRDAFAANPQRYTSGATVAENRRPANGPVVR